MKVSERRVAILLCLLVVQIIAYANGDKCHSIPTLNQPTQKNTQTACDSFLWHGTTYTVSGVYIYQHPNSTLAEELILTINKSTSSTLTQTACDSFVWHGTTYTESGTHQFVTTNAVGCTHTEILELTITKEISPAWYKTLGGVGNDGIYASTIDDNGNVYIMGLVENTFNFSAGNPATEITNGGRFIAKYNAQGNLIWAKRIPRANTTNSDIVLDKYGNIYATSVFSGTNVDFDPDPNKTFTLSSTTNNIYVVKFSPEGEFLWAKNEYGFINFQNSFHYVKINVNESNDVTLLWNQRSNNSLLGRFVRLTDNGTTVWTKIFKPQGHVGANNFTTDASGNIYWVCSLSAAVDFSFDSQPSNVLTPLGTVDIVLSKINNTGDFIWSKQVSGPDVEGVTDIKLDESGSMFIVGWFFQTVTFGNSTYTSQGSSDAFLSKLDANGNFLWTKTWGGSSSDYAIGLDISSNGNIYVSGFFRSIIDLDPDPNNIFSFNDMEGNSDHFISKFTAQGEFITANQIRTTSFSTMNPVVVNKNNEIFVSGHFENEIFLTGISGPSSISNNKYDMFIVKFNSCHSGNQHNIINATSCDSYTWNGTTYNQSGNYLFLNPATNSTKELNLTINKSTTTTLTQTACDSFEWHGTTYTESGSYQFVTTNAVGCTHTEILELTITKEISPAWYKTLGTTGDELVNASEIDDDGNVYVIGWVQNTFNFFPGKPETEIAGGNGYLAKYNTQGNIIWVKQLPLNNLVKSSAITIDNTGNIYVVSMFSGTNVDFDPDPNKVVALSSSQNNIYIAKFSSNGNLLWAKNEYGRFATYNPMNNPYPRIKVNSANQVTLLWTHRDGFNKTFLGRLVRLTDDGTIVWSKQFKPTGRIGVNDFVSDENGNIYWACSVGIFPMDFSFDPLQSNIVTPNGGWDIVIAKINTFGDYEWVKQIGGTGSDIVADIALDESGNLAIVGRFEETVNFGNQTYSSQEGDDAFLSKLDTNGNFLWTKTWGGSSSDYAIGLDISSDGNIYVSGYFTSITDLDPDPNNIFSFNDIEGNSDHFISKFTAQGEFITANQIRTTSFSTINPVVVNKNNEIFVSGHFENEIFLTGISGPSSISSNKADMFIVKFNSCHSGNQPNIINATSCDSYTWNGTTYSQSGNYLFLNPVTNSTEELNLTINKSTTTTLTQTACDSFEWHGTTYTESGSHQFVTTNAVGCTHTETLDLIITKSTTTTLTQTACDSFEWHGTTYTESGSHQFVTTNAVGCTHTETLALTITKSTNLTLTQTVCDSFEWHGTTYTESGSHQFVTTNAVGCTHTETLALTITKSTNSTLTQTACDSFEWHGTTYTERGSHQFVTTNAVGCTQTETLELTITKSTTTTLTQTACDSFEWHGTTYTESGTYQFTSTNAAGCKHIETLDLKINKSTSSMQTKTTCDSFEWNGKTYTQSGAYQFKTTNEVGCTHTDNLDLEIVLFDETLTYANNLLTVKQSNVDYQWINCNNGKTIEGEINQFFKPKENGKYAVIMSIGECKKQSECFEVADLTELEFKVYPNPFTTEVLTIVIPDTTDYEIVFLNSLGIEMVNYKGNSSNFLNVNFVYESGVYIVILKQNGKIKSLKLVRD
jgi:hypothetical protein